MNKIDWKKTEHRIIWIILIIMVSIIIILNVVIKDIKHNKDKWYVTEPERMDSAMLNITGYDDKGFLRKTIHTLYDYAKQEEIYVEQNEEINLLFNNKEKGEKLKGIENIELKLEDKKIKISDWNENSSNITFKAPKQTGEYIYKLIVTYDNKDSAIYEVSLKVSTSEEIKKLKADKIKYEKVKLDSETKYDLEVDGLNSAGELNYLIPELNEESNLQDSLEYIVEPSRKIRLLFSNDDIKYVFEDNIDFKYYCIPDTSTDLTEIEKINVEKNSIGVYEILAPEVEGKYYIIFETPFGKKYLKILVKKDLEKTYNKLLDKYKKMPFNTENINAYLKEIYSKNLLSKVPKLDKIEATFEENIVTVNYYYNTKEIDPEKLYLTEEFNTNIKEEITMYIYMLNSNIEMVNNINYTKQGKNKLQHEEKYTRLQIKQLYNRT